MKKLICLLFVLMLAGCSANVEEKDGGRLNIAVSVAPEAEFAKGVCGNRADVKVIIPPGYSPETYEPAPRDIAELSEADIYFSIGVPSEDSSIVPSVQNLKEVELDKAVAEKYPDLTLDGGRDPHIWLSVKRAEVMTEKIAEELSALDSENAEYYAENARSYIAVLKKTDEEIRSILSDSECRDFVVFHPSFGYFADEYKLNMYALEKGGKEPSAAETAEMIDFARERNVKAVFYQSETDSTRAKVFAAEIGANAVELSPLAENYTENLVNMAKTIVGAIN